MSKVSAVNFGTPSFVFYSMLSAFCPYSSLIRFIVSLRREDGGGICYKGVTSAQCCEHQLEGWFQLFKFEILYLKFLDLQSSRRVLSRRLRAGLSLLIRVREFTLQSSFRYVSILPVPGRFIRLIISNFTILIEPMVFTKTVFLCTCFGVIPSSNFHFY